MSPFIGFLENISVEQCFVSLCLCSIQCSVGEPQVNPQKLFIVKLITKFHVSIFCIHHSLYQLQLFVLIPEFQRPYSPTPPLQMGNFLPCTSISNRNIRQGLSEVCLNFKGDGSQTFAKLKCNNTFGVLKCLPLGRTYALSRTCINYISETKLSGRVCFFCQ